MGLSGVAVLRYLEQTLPRPLAGRNVPHSTLYLIVTPTSPHGAPSPSLKESWPKKIFGRKICPTYLHFLEQYQAAATASSYIPPSPFLQDCFGFGIRAEFDCVLLGRTDLTGAIRRRLRRSRGRTSGGPGELS